MTTDLRTNRTVGGQLTYVLLLPAFFLLFTMLYNPFGIKDFYIFGGLSYAFHLVMLTSILLLTLLISRLTFYFVVRKTTMLWWHYVAWCAAEAFAASAFIALYTSLFSGGLAYFELLGTCCKFVFLTLVFPYVFLIMWQVIGNKSDDLKSKDSPEEDTLFKFYDEHKKLKFTIDTSAILYINSEFNYIRIHYLEADEVKEFTLRNSMKSLEAPTARHGLVRCHRSYFINPKRVKVLRKDSDGIIVAEMDIPGLRPIPVSKQYYESLSDLL